MTRRKGNRKPPTPAKVTRTLPPVRQLQGLSGPVAVTPQQERQVRDLRALLAEEIAQINSLPAPIPPPPAQHEYVSELFKEDMDNPNQSWVKVTCKGCAFLLLSPMADLSANMELQSPYCKLPFAKRAEADKLMQEWELAVEIAHRKLCEPEVVDASNTAEAPA